MAIWASAKSLDRREDRTWQGPSPWTKQSMTAWVHRLAALETELKATQKLLEAPKKRGFWGWFLQRPVAILVVLMMVGVLGAGAQGVQGFYNGNTYLTKPDLFKVGYIAGVSDAYQNNILDQSDLLKFQRCTRGMTVGQLQAIAEKHLQDKPQFRHDQMAGLVWVAVITSCPQ